MGLIAPIFGALIYWFILFYSQTDFISFLQKSYDGGVSSQLVSLCTLMNLVIFSILMYYNRMKTVRGLVLATFIWVILAIYFKVTAGSWD